MPGSCARTRRLAQDASSKADVTMARQERHRLDGPCSGGLLDGPILSQKIRRSGATGRAAQGHGDLNVRMPHNKHFNFEICPSKSDQQATRSIYETASPWLNEHTPTLQNTLLMLPSGFCCAKVTRSITHAHKWAVTTHGRATYTPPPGAPPECATSLHRDSDARTSRIYRASEHCARARP